MGSLTETNQSLWVGTTLDAEPFPGPAGRARFDVVVVGAGITGLTTARMLVDDGCSVAVLEAGRIGSGVTGYTTAKVTALQRTTLSEITTRHGRERAGAYAAANAAAVERIAGLVALDAIECDFERAPACTYTTRSEDRSAIEEEHEAATAAGLPTRLDGAPELPYEVVAAVWLDDQAQFHPRRYCAGLARAIAAAGGTVVEHARVDGVVREAAGWTVRSEAGDLSADHVVVATHLPFLDRGGFFARAHPYRSYAMAVRLRGERPRGMYISAESPTRSVRSTPDGWTVLGGEGHKVGHDPDTTDRYDALDGWARSEFQIAEVGYRWSAQDYESVDGMPYIGQLIRTQPNLWAATAFRKWGMTNGTVAAMILSDRIAGRDNPWAEAFDATRLAPKASLKSLVQENLDVGRRLVADRAKTLRPDSAVKLAAGEGGIVSLDGDVVAAYRDDSGRLHAVSATCTHLGCRLAFNTAERSWDCPCHGSRFGLDGRVLQGPAVKDLERKTPE